MVNPSNNIFPTNASMAFIKAYTDDEEVKIEDKLCSSTSIGGRNFVRRLPLPVDSGEANKIFKQISVFADRAASDCHQQ